MEPMNLKIGGKLKSLRATRSLSLDDVSALTDGLMYGEWNDNRRLLYEVKNEEKDSHN